MLVTKYYCYQNWLNDLQSLRSIKGGNFSECTSIFLQSSQNDQRIVFVTNKESFLVHCFEDGNKNENTLSISLNPLSIRMKPFYTLSEIT